MPSAETFPTLLGVSGPQRISTCVYGILKAAKSDQRLREKGFNRRTLKFVNKKLAMLQFIPYTRPKISCFDLRQRCSEVHGTSQPAFISVF